MKGRCGSRPHRPSLIDAWRSVRARATELRRQLLADARCRKGRQLLMSILGVSPVTATSFITAIEDPAPFRRSRSVRRKLSSIIANCAGGTVAECPILGAFSPNQDFRGLLDPVERARASLSAHGRLGNEHRHIDRSATGDAQSLVDHRCRSCAARRGSRRFSRLPALSALR